MTNKDISNILKQSAALMALHDENQFKIKMYESAGELVRNFPQSIREIPASDLENYDGIGKKIAAVITEIIETGSFEQLNELAGNTPSGLIEVLNMKGIGAKKVRSLWKELNVESLEDVVIAGNNNQISQLKGFGAKTQEKIMNIANFKIGNRGKLLYADAEAVGIALRDKIGSDQVELVGELVRGCDIVNSIQYLVQPDFDFGRLDFLQHNEQSSSPWIWRGNEPVSGARVEFIISEQPNSDKFLLNSGPDHLDYAKDGNTLLKIAKQNPSKTDKEIYEMVELPYFPEGIREGNWELKADPKKIDQLIKNEDLKGVLHNHSVYSDGKNTVEEMTLECIKQGYSYFGISDHSKTAFYANGLYEDKVEKQHKEIDELNAKYPDFKIFKGIESDILGDGALDYSDDVLASFDFIVASIHSGLDMDINKSMQRLITAIENPYTTFLGHVTGRLLLQREGYPVNHKKIIDACAANNVVIELNANPWRLDMDWRHIDYALEKNVMIAINPDAHVIDGIADMKYGVVCARKGGLTTDMCFNAKPMQEVESFFKSKSK